MYLSRYNPRLTGVFLIKIGKKRYKTEFANTFWEKTRGLMFRPGLEHALIFPLERESRIGASIHSFFVFFPFDVLFLDEGQKIVDMKMVGPFRFNVRPKESAKYIIELPAGAIRDSGVHVGDTVNIHQKQP
jgi:uncharacterized membrane protein (UPF0127 family)